jgi:hypothetical protein
MTTPTPSIPAHQDWHDKAQQFKDNGGKFK